MEKLAPLGPVYQAGTYSGNPVSVSASLAILQSLKKRAGQLYSRLEKMGDVMRRRIRDSPETARITPQGNGLGTLFPLFFTVGTVRVLILSQTPLLPQNGQFC